MPGTNGLYDVFRDIIKQDGIGLVTKFRLCYIPYERLGLDYETDVIHFPLEKYRFKTNNNVHGLSFQENAC